MIHVRLRPVTHPHRSCWVDRQLPRPGRAPPFRAACGTAPRRIPQEAMSLVPSRMSTFDSGAPPPSDLDGGAGPRCYPDGLIGTIHSAEGDEDAEGRGGRVDDYRRGCAGTGRSGRGSGRRLRAWRVAPSQLDDTSRQRVVQGYAKAGGFLFGRRTYDNSRPTGRTPPRKSRSSPSH